MYEAREGECELHRPQEAGSSESAGMDHTVLGWNEETNVPPRHDAWITRGMSGELSERGGMSEFMEEMPV